MSSKKKRHILNSKEKDIIRTLHKKSGAMTANEISVETGIAYVTVRKYLKILHDSDVIKVVRKYGETKKKN